jgi:hypothetical protein
LVDNGAADLFVDELDCYVSDLRSDISLVADKFSTIKNAVSELLNIKSRNFHDISILELKF